MISSNAEFVSINLDTRFCLLPSGSWIVLFWHGIYGRYTHPYIPCPIILRCIRGADALEFVEKDDEEDGDEDDEEKEEEKEEEEEESEILEMLGLFCFCRFRGFMYGLQSNSPNAFLNLLFRVPFAHRLRGRRIVLSIHIFDFGGY